MLSTSHWFHSFHFISFHFIGLKFCIHIYIVSSHIPADNIRFHQLLKSLLPESGYFVCQGVPVESSSQMTYTTKSAHPPVCKGVFIFDEVKVAAKLHWNRCNDNFVGHTMTSQEMASVNQQKLCRYILYIFRSISNNVFTIFLARVCYN